MVNGKRIRSREAKGGGQTNLMVGSVCPSTSVIVNSVNCLSVKERGAAPGVSSPKHCRSVPRLCYGDFL